MITVLGSINMDLIATTARLPQPGETVSGNGFSTAAGGKGANQALAARRAGSTVRMVGAVGDDHFAAPALDLLKQAGTDLTAVKTTGEPTGTALILVGGDGENVIVVVPGANAEVSAADATRAIAAMQADDILMVPLEIPAGTVETGLTAAKARGISSLINIAPLTADAARLAKLADIIVANETEFELLAGVSALTAAERIAHMQRIHQETGQTLIVTLGADGVVAVRDGQVTGVQGLKIAPVDTVGAGDTFCGYLASGLDQGMDFADALRRAAVAGSLACTKAGAQPSIPVAADVDAAV